MLPKSGLVPGDARRTAGFPLLPSAAMSATASDPAATGTPPAPSAPASAVSISHLRKGFRLPHEQYHTLKERALHPFRTRSFDVLQAVDDVTVDIARGEFFGIVGRNGSGKSTLLKCLAGIYDTDSGSVEIHGRLSPFIELGVGFNPDLAARDNVIINAIMLGLSRSQARERFDAIVQFAELEDYMDLKLKNYSSGMQVRLAFAVAIQVDADVLLIDEVLAVGDAAFQQKCFDEFTRLKAAGRTIVFVTHDMGAVERFCDRAMLLERGKVVEIGKPAAIARRYNETNFRHVRQVALEEGGPDIFKQPPVAEIISARFESPDGEGVVSMAQGEGCRVRMRVRFHDSAEDPLFSVVLRSERGHLAFVGGSSIVYGPTGVFRAGDVVSVTISFENWLAPGRYTLTPSVNRNGPGADSYDTREDIASILVHASLPGGGVVDLPHTVEIERG
jgi:ABC-type polysaccharide/polyol phosphate transport system ATPase subunit